MGQERLWVQSKKDFLNKIKLEVRALEGALPRDLQDYSKKYEDQFSGKWSHFSKKALGEELANCSIALGADFHAYNQAQRAHLRLLRQTAFKKPLIIALECVAEDSQDLLDQYSVGKIKIDELPIQLNWAEHWPFPWEHYRPIFDWSKKNKVRLLAIGTSKKLTPNRFDLHAFSIIKKNFDPSVNSLYVIIGELHLADNHLPDKLRAWLKKLKLESKNKLLVLHLDSEKLYLNLLNKNLENKVEVLKKNQSHYCLFVSPPWMKWQSYLLYLEQTYDSDLYSSEEDAIDLTDHVVRMIDVIGSDVGLSVNKNDLHVVNSTDRMMQKLIAKMPKWDLGLANWLVDQDHSFFDPQQRFMYLSRMSINHAAELAGAYIYSQSAKLNRLFWRFPSDFERQIWFEAVVFMLSKMVNPKRKAESLENLRTKLESAGNDPITKEVLLLCIDQLMLEASGSQKGKKRSRKFKTKKMRVYYQAARILGQMLGEKMFTQFRKSDFKNPRLKQLILFNPENAGFYEMYYGINRRQ